MANGGEEVREIHAKILKQHRKGCIALEHYKSGFWSTPWAHIISSDRRDAIGRNHPHGMTLWYVFCCNDPQCKAQKIVSADAIAKIEEGEQG
jgi:hypothetical protein